MSSYINTGNKYSYYLRVIFFQVWLKRWIDVSCACLIESLTMVVNQVKQIKEVTISCYFMNVYSVLFFISTLIIAQN